MKKFSFLFLFVFFFPFFASASLLDDLVSYWTFDETSGLRLDSFSSNDLEPINSPSYATGLLNNALDLSSVSSQYLYIPKASTTDFDITGSWSFNGWVKLKTASVSHNIIGTRSYSNGLSGYFCFVQDNNKIGLYNMTGSSVDSTESVSSLSSGVWYMISCIYDGSSMKIYIDGVLDKTYSSSLSPTTNSDPFWIGGSAVLDDANAYFDEFSFWSRAITLDEISLLFNSGSPLPFSDFVQSTSTASSTRSITYDDWLFINQVNLFLTAFIGIGILFSIFRQKR